jgi:hypothetical protein
MIFELTPAGCELEHLTKSSEKQKQKKKKKRQLQQPRRGKMPAPGRKRNPVSKKESWEAHEYSENHTMPTKAF